MKVDVSHRHCFQSSLMHVVIMYSEFYCGVCVISLTSSLHIDKRNLLPPLLVIQTLAHNSTATLAVVKVCHPSVLPSLCILYLSVASLVE